MYNEGLADNTTMIVGGTNVPIEPPSLDQHPEVKQARKLLLIFVGINLVLWLINFLFVIHTYAANDALESQNPHSSRQLASIIISLMYYGFGLLVVYRYYQTGLFIFTILGLILLVLTCALAIVLLIGIIHTANTKGFESAAIIVQIIFVTICFLCLILQIFIIGFAFKLYRLLKANKRLTIEQI